MAYPATFRDSTQLRVNPNQLDEVQPELESRFMVTICTERDGCRIVGTPTEIQRVGRFLLDRGVCLP